MTTAPAAINPTLTLGGDLTVNRLGFGAMHLTGPGTWGPPADEANAIRVLRTAVDLGVNFINTADSYGPGDNERVIREALYPYPDHLVICTKGGLLRSGPEDWAPGTTTPYIVPLGRPAYLRQQVELSLRNLGLDRIDLYELHAIDPLVPLADQLGELVQLQTEGKLRHIGVSGQPGVSVEQLAEARKTAGITAVENRFNIADTSGDDVVDHTQQEGIAFIPWFPLGNGGLLRADGALAAIAGQFDATAAQLALAWLLRRSPTMLPIPGTSDISHLRQNMQAANMALSEADWAVVEEACTTAPTGRPAG
ncbi:aldo/keto reductase [Streptomyces wuyuanensis]|uniref:aldo/keto reductase n=1 Tax=Streptomyces wuyuanensis TaxID=1196353 RepID=UPI0036908BFC